MSELQTMQCYTWKSHIPQHIFQFAHNFFYFFFCLFDLLHNSKNQI